MKNKRAIVLPETLKIIIGVLCILILIYLAWSLYSLFIKKTALEQAKETLNQIVAEIDGLGEGEEKSYLIVAPKNWRILSYEEEKKICVCPQVTKPGEQRKVCEKQGICSDISFNLNIGYSCYYNDQNTFALALSETKNCISLVALPKEIIITKNNQLVELKTPEDAKLGKLVDSLLKFKIDEGKTTEELAKELADSLDNEKVKTNLVSQIENFLVLNKILKENRKGGIGEEGWQLDVFKGEELLYYLLSPEYKIQTRLKEVSLPVQFAVKNSKDEEYTFVLKIGVWDTIEF